MGTAAKVVLLALVLTVWQLAWPDTGEGEKSGATGAVGATGGAGASGRAGAQTAPSPELTRLLAQLARRAELHHSLLYRFQCTEDLTRRVQRRPGYLRSGFLDEETVHTRCGIVVEQGQGEEGVATVIRTKVDHKGSVKLDKKGEPVETDLPALFEPVVNAVPHAQAASFTTKNQADLDFHLLSEMGDGEPDYRIKCPAGHVGIEFLDQRPPRFTTSCHADSSGQMCVDPGSGEISALVFYGLDREVGGCFWNRKAPFAMIEQGLIESRTGARFPSRMVTIYSINSRDNAVFEQLYEECGFTHVETSEDYGTAAGGTAP